MPLDLEPEQTGNHCKVHSMHSVSLEQILVNQSQMVVVRAAVAAVVFGMVAVLLNLVVGCGLVFFELSEPGLVFCKAGPRLHQSGYPLAWSSFHSHLKILIQTEESLSLIQYRIFYFDH